MNTGGTCYIYIYMCVFDRWNVPGAIQKFINCSAFANTMACSDTELKCHFSISALIYFLVAHFNVNVRLSLKVLIREHMDTYTFSFKLLDWCCRADLQISK